MIKLLKNEQLRKKIFFSLFIIFIFRILTHIPVPGVDLAAIRSFLSGNAFFGLFDLFSGGGFQNFSVITLGLGPYINASIILQLFSKIIPTLEELSKEGESGREKLNTYTKMLTVPLSLVQGYGVYFLLSKQGVMVQMGSLNLTVLLFSLVAGSMLMIWLGDLVTEYGVGQGISLLIFVGIVSRLPTSLLSIVSLFESAGFAKVLFYFVFGILIIMGIVLVNEGTRNIPIEYGRRGIRSEKVTNYLPVKINQAGVIPIIFAVSIVMIPSLISGPLMATSNQLLQNVGNFLVKYFSSQDILYNLLYFLLVFGFTFFYTFMQFDPNKIADDIKKRGGFIPGIRPGRNTESFLREIIVRITLIGAIFLGLIAILPYFIQSITGASNLAIGGTGILIVVSVVLDTIRQVESMMVTRNYQSFLE
ncbi:preprotein translocase subunit SecY [candidate division WWE3 bacterium RBG_19FT_COMBO_34_6]|uniref:Protein translocase subunit SecY n=1 Tax=candidate division WWE3 bacterium RBG_19FT_COMBO_34_6 TaxID=1802612 RepID=A0A1F4UJN3_UNCKA|nr:MAG: preprotein translocase subunit SecY [candidate division WWE3 bacterium RBG_19FT_COMBO_34_6]